MTLANLIRRKRDPQPAPLAQGAGTRSPSSDFQRRREAEPGPTHRRWSIRTPDGQTWSVTCCPPVAHGEMAQSWPPGSTVTPVPDRPRPTDSPALGGSLEARIRAWLASIGEQDASIIAEVLDCCRHEPDVLRFYLDQAQNMPGANTGAPTSCGTCAHYRRGDHPHLGHCQAGEPEPTAGRWDATPRSCDQWEAKP
jgi:hypothetical protein